MTVSCGGLEETGTAVTLELTAAQLVTPLTAVMTYLRDSSDAYNLVVELSGEAVTQDEYRETLDDAIAEMSESAAEMPAATFRLTRTFKDGRQLSAAFEVTVEEEFTLTGEMITLNPSSKKSAFSLDRARRGAGPCADDADGRRLALGQRANGDRPRLQPRTRMFRSAISKRKAASTPR